MLINIALLLIISLSGGLINANDNKLFCKLAFVEEASTQIHIKKYRRKKYFWSRSFQILLGNGFNGSIWLEVEKGKNKDIIKKYKEKENLDNDLLAFEVEKKLFSDLVTKYGIKFPKYKKISDDTLRLEYIYGITVGEYYAWLIKNKKFEEAYDFKSNYNKMLEEFSSYSNKLGDPDYPNFKILMPDYDSGLNSFFLHDFNYKAKLVQISLKPDNILINNDSLVIIDPF